MTTSTFNAAVAGKSVRTSLVERLIAWYAASAKPVAGTWADGAFGL